MNYKLKTSVCPKIGANAYRRFYFFHPAYTVGIGIAPIREKLTLFFADFTAGGELHPAPKYFYIEFFFFATRPKTVQRSTSTMRPIRFSRGYKP